MNEPWALSSQPWHSSTFFLLQPLNQAFSFCLQQPPLSIRLLFTFWALFYALSYAFYCFIYLTTMSPSRRFPNTEVRSLRNPFQTWSTSASITLLLLDVVLSKAAGLATIQSREESQIKTEGGKRGPIGRNVSVDSTLVGFLLLIPL